MTGTTSEPVTFTTAGAVRGARAVVPILPGVVAFGLVYGFLAGERGLSLLEIGLMSTVVFAGRPSFWRWSSGAIHCRWRRWCWACW